MKQGNNLHNNCPVASKDLDVMKNKEVEELVQNGVGLGISQLNAVWASELDSAIEKLHQ